MAHNVATANGKTSFFYHGEAPWHGLGQRLDAPATAQEAITAAGLDYEVQLTPLATYDGLAVEGRKAVVRYDKQEAAIPGVPSVQGMILSDITSCIQFTCNLIVNG